MEGRNLFLGRRAWYGFYGQCDEQTGQQQYMYEKLFMFRNRMLAWMETSRPDHYASKKKAQKQPVTERL